MSALRKALSALWADESGQDVVEYLLLIILIALIVMTGVQALTSEMTSAFVSDAGTLDGF